MKTLLYVTSSASDAVSFYRGVGVLADLHRQCPKLNIVVAKKYDWTMMNMADGVFMQRPCFEDEYEIMKMAKMCHRKVWVDHDDDLFHIPTDNAAFQYFEGEDIRKRIVTMVHNADIVTVQSQFLKEWYSEYNNNIHIVPNALDVNLLKFRKEPPPPRQKIVMWRGSVTHHRDVATIADRFFEVADHHPDWKFCFIGDPLWFITDHLTKDRWMFVKAMDIFKYHQFIYNLAPSVVMVPLHDSVFNRSKSNIAWLEGSFAGARTVAPYWDQWKQPGVLNYTDSQSFAEQLDRAMREPVDGFAYDSWETVKEKFNLTKVNQTRIDVLCELFECNRSELM